VAALDPALRDLRQLGFGLGLRNVHFDAILNERPAVDWFEAISENFMDSAGRPRAVLNAVADRYPIVLHGVSLSIGSTDPLDLGYLARLKRLADDVRPAWISDHLCWTGVLGMNSHDLLPLPLTEECLGHVGTRVRQVQDILQRPLVIENPSSYVHFVASTMSEPEFLARLSEATGCGLLLDVNNVHVSCFNARSDPRAYLAAFPFDRVVQMHLAGHQNLGTHIVDTHDGPVQPAVWDLFAIAWQRTGGVSTLLEWDDRIPSLDACRAELAKAQAHLRPTGAPIPDPVAETLPERVSNPSAFLVPPLMESVREGA
jgi:uncharacterized protein